jgi:hypothetical protein
VTKKEREKDGESVRDRMTKKEREEGERGGEGESDRES